MVAAEEDDLGGVSGIELEKSVADIVLDADALEAEAVAGAKGGEQAGVVAVLDLDAAPAGEETRVLEGKARDGTVEGVGDDAASAVDETAVIRTGTVGGGGELNIVDG